MPAGNCPGYEKISYFCFKAVFRVPLNLMGSNHIAGPCLLVPCINKTGKTPEYCTLHTPFFTNVKVYAIALLFQFYSLYLTKRITTVFIISQIKNINNIKIAQIIIFSLTTPKIAKYGVKGIFRVYNRNLQQKKAPVTPP